MNHTSESGQAVDRPRPSMNGRNRRRMRLGWVHSPAQTSSAQPIRSGYATDLFLGLRREQEIVRDREGSPVPRSYRLCERHEPVLDRHGMFAAVGNHGFSVSYRR
jgi:hypothetical protein